MAEKKEAQKATTQSASQSIEPKLAGLISWLLAPIGSILVLVMNKDEFSKFHAWQSILWFVVSLIIASVMSFTIILACIAWVPFVVNLIGAIKAYQGEEFMLPVIGDFAKEQAKK